MKLFKNRRIVALGLLALFGLQAKAQQAVAKSDEKALELIDKAIGDVFFTDNYAVYFDAITVGATKPEDIFTLPIYKVFKGGHIFVDKDKYEIDLGVIKSLSDGKLVVMIEETGKNMYVDSVRATSDLDTVNDVLNTPEFNESIKDYFMDGVLKYEGIVDFNKHKCHKIKSIIKNNTGGTHVLYWIEVKTGMLYVMAEYQNKAYTVYLVNKVGKAPAKNKYDIFLPNKTLKEYHGYTVLDNRFEEAE